MKNSKMLMVFLMAVVILAGCSSSDSIYDPTLSEFSNTESSINNQDSSSEIIIDNDFTISFDGESVVFSLYESGCESISELMDKSILVVRAIPVSVEAESDFAICYVLNVIESNAEEIETIRLRQMKDEYQLDIGEEVVLALAPDEGEGYYHIPAGGAGLFTVNETTAAIEGELLDDLLENSPAPLSADFQVTLEDVFDLLCTFE